MNQTYASITSLLLAPDLMAIARSGAKTITIRNGARDIAPGPLTLVNAADSGDTLAVEVTSVSVAPFHTIDAQDIRDDGAPTHQEMLAAMRAFYPDITMRSVCTVVRWKIAA